MKRITSTIILLTCMMTFMASCSSNKEKSSMIPTEDTSVGADSIGAVEQNQADPALIENRVKAIYESVATAYPEIQDITPSTDSLDLAYCSGEWQTLVEMVNAKDANEMGAERFFDSDYWIMGQDWGKISISDIKVDVKDNNHADVNFILHNLSDTKVKLEMVFERGEWLIGNFIDISRDHNWKASMMKYLEKDNKKTKELVGEEIIEYKQ